MKLNWIEGRGKTGYFKLKLFQMFKCDLYLLKYPPGSSIGWHFDPAFEGYRHYRLNLILRNAKGGDFKTTGPCIVSTKRLNFFRPDVIEHCVSKVEEGTRYVLSLGWLAKDKEKV